MLAGIDGDFDIFLKKIYITGNIRPLISHLDGKIHRFSTYLLNNPKKISNWKTEKVTLLFQELESRYKEAASLSNLIEFYRSFCDKHDAAFLNIVIGQVNEKNKDQISKLLTEKKADGYTLLHHVILNEDINLFKQVTQLIKQDLLPCKLLHVTDAWGATPLQMAKFKGYDAVVNDLFKNEILDEKDIVRLDQYVVGMHQNIRKAKEDFESFGGKKVSENIQNYGIKDEKALIDIAKMVAMQKSQGVFQDIQNYWTTDVQSLLKIASQAAKQNIWGVSRYIQNYRIKDEKALIDIAKIEASRDDSEVSRYIQNYGIKNEKALIDIAKIVANKGGLGVSLYIQNYKIKDERALIKIAEIVAKQDGRWLSCYIKNYGIKDEKVLIDIAKIAANQDGCGLFRYIKNYGIKDEKALIEITRIAIQKSGLDILESIRNYKITKQSLIELFLITIVQDVNFWRYKNWFAQALPENNFYKKLLDDAESIVENVDVNLFKEYFGKDFFKDVQAYCFDYKNHGNFIRERQFNQKRLIKQLYPLFVILKYKNVNNSKIEKYLLSIAKIRDFQLRDKVLSVFISVIVDNKYDIVFQSLSDSPSRKLTFVFDLLSVVLFKNKQFKLSSGIRNDRIKTQMVLFSLLSIYNHRNLFKNQDVYAFCSALAKGRKDEVIQNFQITGLLIELNQTGLLFNKQLSIPEKITKLLEELMGEKLVDKPSAYFDPILNARNPIALFLYWEKTKQMPEEHQKAFKRFVEAILEGKFPKIRYQTEGNPHIEKLSKIKLSAGKTLLDKWSQTPEPEPLVNYLSQTEEQKQSFDVKKWLQNKLNDGHIDPNQFPNLAQVVNEELTSKQAIEQIKNSFTQLGENDQLEIELIQLYMKESFYTNIKNLKKRAVKALGEDSKFVQNDLKKLEKKLMVVSKLAQLKAYSLHNSDNWEDLLLCGTEVLKSCERVDERSFFNQGLLGYLLDGKYRILLIKKGKEIRVRAMLRLLWDEDEKEPVLFLEVIYSRTPNEVMKKALVKYAINQAKEYGLPLVTKMVGFGGGLYHQKLKSLGSLSPCECVDAGEGICFGNYIIEGKMYILSDPKAI